MPQTPLTRCIPPAALLLLLWPLAVRGQPVPQDAPPPAPVPVEQPGEQPAPPPPVGDGTAPVKPPPADAEFSPWGPSLLMNPVFGHALYHAGYRVSWFPDEPVAGQPTNLGYVQQDLSVGFPLWQDCTNEWTGSVNVRGELFNTGAILPDTRQPFPEDLWNIRFGTTYRHLFDNGWIAGGTVTVGSASDKPFHSINEMTAGVNAFWVLPQGGHNAWLFTLTYSPTSELAFPLPGVAYIWQPSDRFRMNIGLPFQVWYRPTDELTLDFSYMLLRTVHARASYHLGRPFVVYAGYDWENESYFLADRLDERDRFFYYNQRLSAGVRAILNKHLSLDLSGGYVFDRFYFEGRSFSDSHHNRVDIGDGPFLSFQIQSRW
jgi:hypothetical protein